MSKIIYENRIVKKIFYDWQKDRFINEIYWLKKLSKYKFIPKIIDIDYKNRILIITNEGDKLTSSNLPSNWQNQLNKILKCLSQNNCFHGDINSENILVRNKKLKLIDFAQSTIKKGKEIVYLKKRMFFDEYAQNRIAINVNKSSYNSNYLRTLVVWDKSNQKKIDKEIIANPNLKIIDKIFISKNFYEDIYKDKIFWLDKFYNRPIDRNSLKLRKDLYCYIIISKNPIFKLNKMLFTKDERFVDENIFKFKKKIRKKQKNIIHISDNFEEAKRNALFISRTKNTFPYRYFLKSQFVHHSLSTLIKKLNNEKKLKYIFLRNIFDKNGDIDVLCNNYYLFKQLVDGQSFKKKNLNIISNSGDPYEDYGFKVSNFVKVKNKEVCFDIRSIGDNYFDKKWQNNLLKKRIKKSNYFTLKNEDKLYSLVYHIVYHKGYIDKKYIKFLNLNLKKDNIKLNFLKSFIDKYLEQNNYNVTRPNDLTIPITFKMNKQQRLKEFELINNQIEINNNSGANKMLLNFVKHQRIRCFFDNKFIILIIKNLTKYFKQILKHFIFKKISRSYFTL
jgi:hypothetical protein